MILALALIGLVALEAAVAIENVISEAERLEFQEQK